MKIEKNVMLRLLDLPRGLQKTSRERFFIEPFIKSFSFYIRNVAALQELYQNTDPQNSSNNSSNQQYSSGNKLYSSNSTFNKDSAKNIIPLPDWSVALSRWGLFWDFHVYGFSGLYLTLTLVSALIYLRFRVRFHRLKIVFNTLILLATSCLFRAVFMLVDPYGYKGSMAGLMIGIMTQSVYPLFCACYGLTQVILIRVTKAEVGHSRLRTLSCLLGCTLTYLFLIVVIETLVFYEHSLKLLLILDSGCFIVWSLCLGVTFICSGFKLAQFTKENETSRKELDVSVNHQRSTSNTTGFSAISNTTNTPNDANVNVFNIGLTSPITESTTSAKTSGFESDIFVYDAAKDCLQPIFPTTLSPLQIDRHVDENNRSTRSKTPKQDHLTIALMTDEDNKSTSSTDIDGSHAEGITKQTQTRRRKKQKHSHSKNKNKPESTTLLSAYSSVAMTTESSDIKENVSGPRKRHRSSNNDQQKELKDVSGHYSSISCTETSNCQNEVSTNKHELNVSPVTCREKAQQEEGPQVNCSTSLALPVLASSHLLPHTKINSVNNTGNESLEDYDCDDEQDENEMSKNQIVPSNSNDYSNCVIEENVSPSNSCAAEVNVILKVTDLETTIDTSLQNHECLHTTFSPEESMSLSPHIDHDQVIENGYLADCENVRSSFSELKPSRRKTTRRHETISSDVSSKRSSSSSSSDESTTTEDSNRRESNLLASSGSLSVKQRHWVLRAIYLTYVLTFLFMFACLLQLYTLFGVYGVMGTIPIPDPWPWLIFQSIFRLTEVSICLTIAIIAFIVLNHRHQRAKKRLQQQEEQQQQQQRHQEVTGDCIV